MDSTSCKNCNPKFDLDLELEQTVQKRTEHSVPCPFALQFEVWNY